MSYFIEMPRYGANMEEGTIGEWLVADGSAVKKGDPLCMIEIEKLTNEVLAEEDGVLKQILEEGETVECGVVIGSVAAEGEVLNPPFGDGSGSQAEDTAVEPAAVSPAAVPAAVSAPSTSGAELPGDVRLTPKAVKLWEEMGQPVIQGIKGSGYGSMVTREDLRTFLGSSSSTPKPSAPAAAPSPLTSSVASPELSGGSASQEMVLVRKIAVGDTPRCSARIAFAALKALADSPAMRVYAGEGGKALNSKAVLCTVVDSDDSEGLFLQEGQDMDHNVFSAQWTDLSQRCAAGLLSDPETLPPGILHYYDASSQGLSLFQPGLAGLGGMSLTVGAPQMQMMMSESGFSSSQSMALCLTVDTALVSRKAAIAYLNRLETVFKEIHL